MEIREYIYPQLFFVIPILNVIGGGLKNTLLIPDKWIPVALGVISVALCGAYIFTHNDISSLENVVYYLSSSVVQGILCAAAAVYAHQVVKQGGKKDA